MINFNPFSWGQTLPQGMTMPNTNGLDAMPMPSMGATGVTPGDVTLGNGPEGFLPGAGGPMSMEAMTQAFPAGMNAPAGGGMNMGLLGGGLGMLGAGQQQQAPPAYVPAGPSPQMQTGGPSLYQRLLAERGY
jgi:hypothetical protein